MAATLCIMMAASPWSNSKVTNAVPQGSCHRVPPPSCDLEWQWPGHAMVLGQTQCHHVCSTSMSIRWLSLPSCKSNASSCLWEPIARDAMSPVTIGFATGSGAAQSLDSRVATDPGKSQAHATNTTPKTREPSTNKGATHLCRFVNGLKKHTTAEHKSKPPSAFI